MIFVGPMTVIVTLALVGCFVGGVIILVRSMRQSSSRAAKVCGQCRNANPEHAKFCGHCGQPLDLET